MIGGRVIMSICSPLRYRESEGVPDVNLPLLPALLLALEIPHGNGSGPQTVLGATCSYPQPWAASSGVEPGTAPWVPG